MEKFSRREFVAMGPIIEKTARPSLIDAPIPYFSFALPAVRRAPAFLAISSAGNKSTRYAFGSAMPVPARCWFAPHDIHGGKKIHEQIDEAIRLYDKLLLIISPASMSSEWVNTEIAHARQKELNEKRRVLFPISIVSFEQTKAWRNFDADTGKDSAREIREYFIPDFSGWKTDHDAYSKAFERLLKDLRSEKAAGA